MDVQLPDGTTIQGVPEGTTKAQLAQKLQSSGRSVPKEWLQDAPKPAGLNPTDEMSTMDKMRAGAGSAMHSVGQGLKQAIDIPSKFIESHVPGLAELEKKHGFTTAEESAQHTQEAIDETRQIDKPLLDTKAGRAGSIGGAIVTAAPTMLIPGANTAVGAALIGGATGALQPVATGESRAKNTALGASFGYAGQKVGTALSDLASSRLSKIGVDLAEKKAQNAERDAAVAAAKKAGYVMPPSQANPTMLNRVLEGVSGKIKTAQGASVKNQEVTNDLVRQGLGLSKNAPITSDTLKAVRDQAGESYAAISRIGTPFKATQEYHQAIDGLGSATEKLAAKYPKLLNSKELEDLKSSLKVSEMDPAEAVEMTKILREKASDLLSGNASGAEKSLGRSYRSASNAVENMIEANLTKTGQKGVLKDFRDARTLIAKTYTVEKSLNSAGNVDANILASQLKRGKPLSGGLKTAAEFAGRFPKAAKTPEQVGSHLPVDALDFLAAIGSGIASGHATGGAAILARPAVRAGILSDAGNRFLTQAPSYEAPALAKVLANSRPLQEALPGASAAVLPKMLKDRAEQ